MSDILLMGDIRKEISDKIDVELAAENQTSYKIHQYLVSLVCDLYKNIPLLRSLVKAKFKEGIIVVEQVTKKEANSTNTQRCLELIDSADLHLLGTGWCPDLVEDCFDYFMENGERSYLVAAHILKTKDQVPPFVDVIETLGANFRKYVNILLRTRDKVIGFPDDAKFLSELYKATQEPALEKYLA